MAKDFKTFNAGAKAALDALDAQHRKVQSITDPDKFGPEMEKLRTLFEKASSISFELTKRAIAGDEEAARTMKELEPRFEESTKELQKSQAHVLKTFTAAMGYLATPPDKLPRA